MPKTDVFNNLKVLDFSTSLVGPGTTRLFADYGATVVKVESVTHLDVLRTNRPYSGGITGINRSGYFASYNAGKYSISLNMNKPEALKIARKLVIWADILIESYRPGIMEKWGLDYENVKKIRPDIIMLSTTMLGQNGPNRNFRGYGHHGAALAGWGATIGWPSRDPILPFGAYTDYVSLRYVVIAILGALEYRRRTGKGQYIDNSQVECSIGFEAPLILDYSANGRLIQPQGNRDPYAAPHGAFRCRGDDNWVAIAVGTQEEWSGFCKVIGEPAWTKESRFATIAERKKNEDELERLVEIWTIQKDAEEIAGLMQAGGVPAAAVASSADMHGDPQLRHRTHFTEYEHPEMGPFAYENFGFRLSKTPGAPRSADPCLGQHNHYVCNHLLGISDEEFVKLTEEGVFE
jgi:benzylsuccinate CoA-transferase BbsF subunit